MKSKAPGKSHRKGISLMELAEMFPTEQSAVEWFESIYWPEGRCCGHCGSTRTKEVPNKSPMPYWCTDCRKYFSVRTGTTLAHSRVPLRKWAFAVYLYVTSLKGVSSMRLHRELGVTQKTAWFMLHRLREAWNHSGLEAFIGPIEVDETYIGGKERNKHAKARKHERRGGVGKVVVAGARDRAIGKVSASTIDGTDKTTLHGFVKSRAHPDASVYTDDHKAYSGLPYKHKTVKHSISEYVNGQAHTNGIESFWALFKRGYHGIYHHLSKKHLDRYVSEFSGCYNTREADTIDQMRNVVASMIGKRLMYQTLIGN